MGYSVSWPARLARQQLDKLQQGGRSINDYIADFQKLETQIGAESLGEANALHAFERGLRADIADKLRTHGVNNLEDAIAMAARVGGLTAATPAAPRAWPSRVRQRPGPAGRRRRHPT